MRMKHILLGLLSIAAVGVGVERGAAFFGCNCCGKYSTVICCRPYNAFTPCCFGTICADGCCPLASCTAPGCYNPCCMTPPFYPPLFPGCGYPAMAWNGHGFPPPHHLPPPAQNGGPNGNGQPGNGQTPDATQPGFTPPPPAVAPKNSSQAWYGYPPVGVQQIGYYPAAYSPYAMPYAPYYYWNNPMPYAPAWPVSYYRGY